MNVIEKIKELEARIKALEPIQGKGMHIVRSTNGIEYHSTAKRSPAEGGGGQSFFYLIGYDNSIPAFPWVVYNFDLTIFRRMGETADLPIRYPQYGSGFASAIKDVIKSGTQKCLCVSYDNRIFNVIVASWI